MNRTRLALLLSIVVSLPMSACHEKDKTVTGTIRMNRELLKTVSSGAVIYVIARHPGEAGGPPVAVKRIPQPFAFPVEFRLSAENAMIPDVPFEGELVLTARLSQSGSATPASSGDVETEAGGKPVEVGAKNVELVLSQVRK